MSLHFTAAPQKGQNMFFLHSQAISLFQCQLCLEQELFLIPVDCAAIKFIIGSKVTEVKFHSRCRRCNKKSLFQGNENARGKKNGVILSASTMLGLCRCLQTGNADAGKQLIVINIAV